MNEIAGIVDSVPLLGWIVVGLLVLLTAFFVFQSIRESRTIERAISDFVKVVDAAGACPPEQRRLGRDQEAIDRIRAAASKLPALPAAWWKLVDETLAAFRQPRQDDGFFLTVAADELLTDDVVVLSTYHGRLQAAVPGLLTSVGLLGTFLAILVGLAGLQPDPVTETVTGVAGLVANLAGKFATSVAALFLSAVYLLFEHSRLNTLRRQRRDLVMRVERAIPRMSLTRVLLDVRAAGLQQTEALGNISSDMAMAFADRFQSVLAPEMARQFSSSLGERLDPSLGALTETMNRIGEAVSNLEREKQDSVVGELRSLIGSMEETLRTSLAAMGDEFRSALTGSTRDEFTNVAKALEGSAGVLQSMNDGFASMQGTLQGLIEESRRTTELQMASGSDRAESLNRLVEGLLIRLNQSATENASQVQGVLATAVGDLSRRVTTLSDDLVARVGAATAASQAAVAETVRHATESSTRTTEEVATLIEELRQRVTDFEAAGQALRDAESFVQRTLQESGGGLRSLNDAAAKVEMLTGALSGTATNVTRTQEAQLKAAEASRAQLVTLEQMSTQHNELLGRYDHALRNARDLFTQLDDRLGSTLDLIIDRVQNYNAGVERNFQVIMEQVNTTMPSMGNLLHTATEELREQVEELSDTLQELRGALADRGTSGNGSRTPGSNTSDPAARR
jgi:ABC-type transporter Mla subunit MlaD